MKKITLFLFVIICLLGGYFLFFKSSEAIKHKHPLLTDKERELFTNLWEMLYFNGNFGYTLLGSKPVSIYNWSKDPLRLMSSPYDFFLEGDVKESWERFCKEHPSDHYALLFTESTFPETDDSPEYVFGEIILINKAKTKACFEKHKDLFTKYLSFTDFSPETIATEVLKSENHELVGLILGFGPHNSRFFQRKYDLSAYCEKTCYFPSPLSLNEDNLGDLTYAYDFFANPINVSPQEVISELRSRREIVFETLDTLTRANPLSPVPLPCFKAVNKHPETEALIETYQKEQKQIIKFGQLKPLLDAILHVYFYGVSHE